jgi:hypothetical protein
MRPFLDKYGVYLVAVAFVVAGIVWFFFGRGGHLPQSAFFIDEDTGQESVRPVTDIPPLIGAKGNPSLVKVYKYSTDGGKTVHVGYYLKFTPEMKAKMEELQQHPDPNSQLQPGSAMLVRKPESGPPGWVKISSSEGQKIVDIDAAPGTLDTIYP